MSTRRLFLGGLGIGTSLCVAALLRVLYVRAAWERTTLHPSSDIDTPGLFFGLGVIFIVVSVVMALFDWVLARSPRNRASNGPT